MNRWEGKVAVVTGASAGIGAQIVEHLLDHGVKVVGLARRKEKLEVFQEKVKDKKGKFYYFIADIGSEEDIVKAFQWIKENVGVVNILVNNAGIAYFSTLIEGNSQHIRNILDTNVFGLCIASREAIKEMQNNKVDGHIIHINSTLGHKIVRGNTMNVYPASKFAVTALTETLRNELSLIGSKIKVTSISPGLVHTEAVETAIKNSASAETDAKAKEMGNHLKTASALETKDVADALIYVLSTPPNVQIHELTISSIGE